MTTVYLAAAFSRQVEIRTVAEDLRNLGVSVCARWLDEQKCPENQNFEDFLADNALNDLQDLETCDTIVRFSDIIQSEMVPAKLISGARMFETGYSYKAGKRVIVIGGRQNVFDRLPGIIHLDTVENLKTMLKTEVIREHKN